MPYRSISQNDAHSVAQDGVHSIVEDITQVVAQSVARGIVKDDAQNDAQNYTHGVSQDIIQGDAHGVISQKIIQGVVRDKVVLVEFIKEKVRSNDKITRKIIAKEAGVKRLLLNHVSARFLSKDISVMRHDASTVFENVHVVKDLEEVEI